MEKEDLLKNIFDNHNSDSQGEDLISDLLSSEDGADTARIFGFSRTEWTAYAHGAGLTEIAQWRYGGWPNTCVICKLPIDINNFGWIVVTADDVSCLRHVRCSTE